MAFRIRRPGRRTATYLLAVGLLVGVPTTIRAVQLFQRSIDGPSLNAPGSTSLHLASGRWIVFELIGTRNSIGIISTTETHGLTISPGNIVVRGDAGVIRARAITGAQTITSGSDIYVGAAEFSVPADGDYEIAIAGPRPTAAMLARSFTDSAKAFAPWAVAALLGDVTALVAFGFLLTSGRAARRAAALAAMGPAAVRQAGGPPPGWYPDPWGGASPRWWDGNQWTGHVAGPPQTPPPEPPTTDGWSPPGAR